MANISRMFAPASTLVGCALAVALVWGVGLHLREVRARTAWVLAAAIIFVAAWLRFAALGDVPNGLFRDEVEKGYTAWTLAHEGGALEFTYQPAHPFAFHAIPLHVRIAGVTTSAIYQYASVPFVAAMGLTPLATRMAAALAGTLAVALLMLVIARAWDTAAGLAAGLALAVQPWHLIFSRWAQQGIFVPLLMIGVLAGLLGVERRRRWGFPLAGLGLGAVYYAYSGAQPFALAWGALLLFQYRREVREQWRAALCGFALFLIGAGPAAWLTFFGGGAARLGAVAVWNEPDATPLLTAWRIATSYLKHFNPFFLAGFAGDSLERHGIRMLGQLLAVDLVLLPFGAWYAHKRNMPISRALISAFFAGPVGAAITWGHIPHSLRAIPMLLPAAAWSGLAIAMLTTRGLEFLTEFNDAMKDPPVSRKAGEDRTIRIATLLLFSGSALLAIGCYYWRNSTDPYYADSFEQTYRHAFTEVARGRAVTERVWVDARLPYAPYFAAYFGQIPAREIVERGFESRGWIFFDASPQGFARTETAMRPGDWIITLDDLARAHLSRKKN